MCQSVFQQCYNIPSGNDKSKLVKKCTRYYIDEDTRYINIYNILCQINDVSDVIDIFDNHIYEIIYIYSMYLKLDRHGKDLIHLKIIKSKN